MVRSSHVQVLLVVAEHCQEKHLCNLRQLLRIAQEANLGKKEDWNFFKVTGMEFGHLPQKNNA